MVWHAEARSHVDSLEGSPVDPLDIVTWASNLSVAIPPTDAFPVLRENAGSVGIGYDWAKPSPQVWTKDSVAAAAGHAEPWYARGPACLGRALVAGQFAHRVVDALPDARAFRSDIRHAVQPVLASDAMAELPAVDVAGLVGVLIWQLQSHGVRARRRSYQRAGEKHEHRERGQMCNGAVLATQAGCGGLHHTMQGPEIMTDGASSRGAECQRPKDISLHTHTPKDAYSCLG